VRQGFLAHAGACGGEKFEQSAAAKQIEIGGIHVMRVVEAIARLSRTRPAVFDSSQSPLAKGCAALGYLLRSQDA